MEKSCDPLIVDSIPGTINNYPKVINALKNRFTN